MIQLYKVGNQNYDMNGDHILSPSSLSLIMNLGDVWNLSMEHSIDEKLNDIIPDAVISVDTPYGNNQLFIIKSITKSDDYITAEAIPIFMKAREEIFLHDVRPTDKNGQEALDIMMEGTNFRGHSDIKTVSTSYFQLMNLIEAINGNQDNSFMHRWGGEIFYKNFDIYINEKIGSDRGLRVEFGFNLMGVTESIDYSDIVTRIVPKAYNGYTLPNNEYVESKNVNKFRIRYKVIEYNHIKLKEDAQESDEQGAIICDSLDDLYSELRKAAKEEFDNGIDLPRITYDVDMVDLSKTDFYKDYKDLLLVQLGDTVYIKNRKLGIETSARVISIEYDCVTNMVTNLVLGDYEANYFDNVSSITNSVDKVIDIGNDTLMANRIAGVINLLNASLRAQKDVAQRQDVRAILFEDLDTKSPTFGALCIGTQGIQIAKKRNPTNDDWVWGTAIDFQSINADYMITGILSDKNGKFYLNLDTGELRMKDGTFVGVINGATINGGEITGTEINGGTINGTTIKTDKDLYVGNNIYLGNEKEKSTRRISSDENNYIYLGKDGSNNIQLHAGTSNLMISELGSSMNVGKNAYYAFYEDFFSIKNGDGNSVLYLTSNSSTLNSALLLGGTLTAERSVHIEGQLAVNDTALFYKDLSVLGKKNRIVKTENFGLIKLNAVESTYAVFEDYGTSITDEKGNCEVILEDKFLETVNTEKEYYVFLTSLSNGSLFVLEKKTKSFIVQGTPNTKFDWRVTVKQKGYEDIRMEEYEEVRNDNDN